MRVINRLTGKPVELDFVDNQWMVMDDNRHERGPDIPSKNTEVRRNSSILQLLLHHAKRNSPKAS